MTDLIRNLLLLAILGVVLTAAGYGAARWSESDRQLRRMLNRALGGAPQMPIIASDHGKAAALNLEQRRVAVLWGNGQKGLVYRIEQLIGAELVIDDRVAARAYRGEPRKALDEISGQAQRVLLRLIFDTPSNPDFELVLWPPRDPARAQGRTALDAVQSARSWVSSVEALLRQPLPPPPPPPPTPRREMEGDSVLGPMLGAALVAEHMPQDLRPNIEDLPWDDED